ncbi:MAG TPA: hypothetical protein VNZ52_03330 [Candidatus Thermoplasmatota archaeon]|nr:hypothetical protein [Candidatus Thermoplasmatota archaeon]
MPPCRAAALLLTFLLLPAPALATHEREDGPPASTFGWAGGLTLTTALNLAPQEITLTGELATEDLPGRQRLVSVGTYACATGQPASGSSAGRYALDVVPLHVMAGAVGFNDHYGDALHAFVSSGGEHKEYDNPAKNPDVFYGLDLYLGTGTTRPATLLPGLVTFHAFLLCGGAPTEVPPVPAPGQAPGLFGWVDGARAVSTGSASTPWTPDLAFFHHGGDRSAGALLPGDVVLTPGWYADAPLLWSPEAALADTAFRFALNPALVEAYPGYTGSRYQHPPGECLLGDEAQRDGLFGTCDEVPGGIAPPPVAPATAGAPAPVLEDVDPYGAPDRFLGVGLLGAAALEARAAAAAVDAAARPVAAGAHTLLQGGAPEPNHAGDEAVKALGGGWSYLLDVRLVRDGPGGPLGWDPLYGTGAWEEPSLFPFHVHFEAVLGLARDANGDGTIDTASSAEWFPIDDYLATPRGERLADWGDVGRLGASTLRVEGPARVSDLCHFGHLGLQLQTYPPGAAIPLGAEDEEEFRECARYGDASRGTWGTFEGTTSAQGTGRYGTLTRIHATPGTGTWTTTVEARIRWPAAAVWSQAGLALPQGLSYGALAGTTVTLRDVDVYRPLA